MKGEKESVLPSVGEEQIGGGYTHYEKESKEELLREMLTLHNQSRNQAKKERVYEGKSKSSKTNDINLI